MSDDFEGRLKAIGAALTAAKPALDGAICANCAHRIRKPGKLACGLRGGPRYAETVQPADSCGGFHDERDDADEKRHRAVVGSTVDPGARAALEREAEIDESRKLAAEAAATPDGAGAPARAAEPPAAGPPAKKKKGAPKAERGAGGGHRRIFIQPLPEGCPVRPLGLMGQTYYYLSAANQLEELSAEKHSRLNLAHLFGGNVDYMASWLPAINAKGQITGPQYEAISASLMKRCNERGLWDKRDRVRGRGCWTGDHGLIMHLGNRIIAGSEVFDPGEIGDYVYPEGGAITRPGDSAEPPGSSILALFQRWNWTRPHLDPLLMLGFAAVAPLGAAMKVRPMVFVTGGHGTGKSALNRALDGLLSRWLLWSNDATSASITAELGLDCLPVAVDENEARADSNRAQQMIEFARLSYSGGTKRRSDSQHKAHEFTLRSAAFFSAINPPAMEPQDKSRFAILKLRELDPDQPEPDLSEGTLRPLGQRMLARWLSLWGQFPERFEQVRAALKKAGHTARGQDTFGTLLTAAWLMIGDEAAEAMGLPFGSRLNELADIMRADRLHETAGIQPNWRECLDRLTSTPVDAFRNSKRQTVGAVLDAVQAKIADPQDESGLGYADADDLLKQAGLKLMRPRGPEDVFRIFIPHESEQLHRLYRGSKWAGIPAAGGWSMALEQAPQWMWTRERQRVNGPTRGIAFTLAAVMDDDDTQAADDGEQGWT